MAAATSTACAPVSQSHQAVAALPCVHCRNEQSLVCRVQRSPSAPRHRRRLRGAHSSIVSSVAFSPGRPWDVYSAGLDCRLACWDFSRGQLKQEWHCNTAPAADESRSQLFNPPMIHTLAVPPKSYQTVRHLVAVGRGDGVVQLIDTEQQTCAIAPGAVRTSSRFPAGKRAGRRRTAPAQLRNTAAQGASSSRPEHNDMAEADLDSVQHRLSSTHLQPPTSSWQCTAHASAVNHISFAEQAPSLDERLWLLSGGNDGKLGLWGWTRDAPALSSAQQQEDTAQTLGSSIMSAASAAFHTHQHGQKVNCVTGRVGGSSLNCVVGDVTNKLTVYQCKG